MTLEEHAPDWTPARLATLAAAVAHLLPMAKAASPTEKKRAAEAVATFVTKTLSSPELEAQRPFVLAALDELHDLASTDSSGDATDDATRAGPRGLAAVTRDELERLLRRLEADPHLSHAVALLLQLSLEGFLGDPRHGGNPGGVGWTGLGLTPLGPRRRLGVRDSTVGEGENL